MNECHEKARLKKELREANLASAGNFSGLSLYASDAETHSCDVFLCVAITLYLNGIMYVFEWYYVRLTVVSF